MFEYILQKLLHCLSDSRKNLENNFYIPEAEIIAKILYMRIFILSVYFIIVVICISRSKYYITNSMNVKI